MKNLHVNITTKPMVLAFGSFSPEFKMSEMTRRLKGLQKRVTELDNQIQSAKRSGDLDDARELEEVRSEIAGQLASVQTLVKTGSKTDRNDRYAEFYLKHGRENPDHP